MTKLMLASVLAGALAGAGAASAGSLNPDLSPMANPLTTANGTMIAGEGAAPNFDIGNTVGGIFVDKTAIQHVDWIVKRDTAANALGGYIYFYQIENTSIFALSTLLIGSGAFTSVNSFSALDLDSNVDALLVGALGHNSANFANLAGIPAHDFNLPVNVGENEARSSGEALVCCSGPNAAINESGSVNAGFVPALKVGLESGIIVATGSRPAYGDF